MIFEFATVALVAGLIAGQINRGIYRLAWNKRSVSPWSSAPGGASRRDWRDRVPVVGWWRLRRETQHHGPGFWLRPALVELSYLSGMVWLYAFELGGGLSPIGVAPPPRSTLLVQFLSHAVLIALMLTATFIDLDEKTIPDEITVPGTWLALIWAAIWPQSRLPAWTPGEGLVTLTPLWLTAPREWSPELDGLPGLTLGLICLAGWWYALLPKTLWYRSGLRKFLQYLGASIVRHPLSRWLTLMAVVATFGTVGIWMRGGCSWRALLTAWVGIAIGGGVVWAVRVVGTLALRQEAMGFGDVTLLAMIGGFLGWQVALLVFFLAPFTGVVMAVTQWLLTGHKDIAYGPFLCLATLVVLLAWPVAWAEWAYPIFALGIFVPIVLGGSLVLLGVILTCLQRIRQRAHD